MPILNVQYSPQLVKSQISGLKPEIAQDLAPPPFGFPSHGFSPAPRDRRGTDTHCSSISQCCFLSFTFASVLLSLLTLYSVWINVLSFPSPVYIPNSVLPSRSLSRATCSMKFSLPDTPTAPPSEVRK